MCLIFKSKRFLRSIALATDRENCDELGINPPTITSGGQVTWKEINNMFLNHFNESLVVVTNNMVDGNIDIENKSKTDLNFEIFNSAGQVVYSNEIASVEKQSFPFFDYPANIYFIRFRSHFRYLTKKIPKFY